MDVRSRQRDRLWPSFLLSVALHAGLFGVASRLAAPPRAQHVPSISVMVVQLGDDRNAADAGQRARARAGDPGTNGALLAAERVRPRAATGKRGDPAERLAAGLAPRPGEQVAEGRWVRVPGGYVLEGSSAADASYIALTVDALRSACVRERRQHDDEDCRGLRAVITVRIGTDGRVGGWSFESRSGSTPCDGQIEAALTKVRLPAPPDDLRARAEREGFRLPLGFDP